MIFNSVPMLMVYNVVKTQPQKSLTDNGRIDLILRTYAESIQLVSRDLDWIVELNK